MFYCSDWVDMICSSFGSMQDPHLCYWQGFDNGKGHRSRIRLDQNSGFELELSYVFHVECAEIRSCDISTQYFMHFAFLELDKSLIDSAMLIRG